MSVVEQRAASALHAHLLLAPTVKINREERLAQQLEAFGCWPQECPVNGPLGHAQGLAASWRLELRAGLRQVLSDARVAWEAYGVGQVVCELCAALGEPNLCPRCSRQRYDWHDDLARLARRICTDVPAQAAETMRSGS